MGNCWPSFQVWSDWPLPNYWEILPDSRDPLQYWLHRMSKDLGIKKEYLGPKIKMNKCALESYEFVCQSRIIWKEPPYLQMFSRRMESNPSTSLRARHPRAYYIPQESRGSRRQNLHFGEQIEHGHTFIPALIADTIKAFCIAKATLSTHLESSALLLQIWFFWTSGCM